MTLVETRLLLKPAKFPSDNRPIWFLAYKLRIVEVFWWKFCEFSTQDCSRIVPIMVRRNGNNAQTQLEQAVLVDRRVQVYS